MPIRVTGYLSHDGNFFTSECEARMHEAEMEIRTHCSVNHIDAEKVINIIEALADPILEYVNAAQEVRAEKAEAIRDAQLNEELHQTADLSEHTTDHEGTDDLSETVLEQSPDGHEPMSDVGSGPSSETVSDYKPSPRSRSRRRNA